MGFQVNGGWDTHSNWTPFSTVRDAWQSPSSICYSRAKAAKWAPPSASDWWGTGAAPLGAEPCFLEHHLWLLSVERDPPYCCCWPGETVLWKGCLLLLLSEWSWFTQEPTGLHTKRYWAEADAEGFLFAERPPWRACCSLRCRISVWNVLGTGHIGCFPMEAAVLALLMVGWVRK